MTKRGTRFSETGASLSAQRSAAFYVCLSPACGLRFPVLPGDSFEGRCPRCGGAAIEVATVERRAAGYPGQPSRPLPLDLLLDNWRSVFNVGSIFRTADGAGVPHLHLCGITPTPAHRKLAKTALGAETSVAWSYSPDALKCAARLQTEGHALWVLESGPKSCPLWTYALHVERPVVLAAGNEIAGVDPALVEMADRVLYIPMHGVKESLNVAVALSIAVYWLAGEGARQITKNDLTT